MEIGKGKRTRNAAPPLLLFDTFGLPYLRFVLLLLVVGVPQKRVHTILVKTAICIIPYPSNYDPGVLFFQNEVLGEVLFKFWDFFFNFSPSA